MRKSMVRNANVGIIGSNIMQFTNQQDLVIFLVNLYENLAKNVNVHIIDQLEGFFKIQT